MLRDERLDLELVGELIELGRVDAGLRHGAVDVEDIDPEARSRSV